MHGIIKLSENLFMNFFFIWVHMLSKIYCTINRTTLEMGSKMLLVFIELYCEIYCTAADDSYLSRTVNGIDGKKNVRFLYRKKYQYSVNMSFFGGVSLFLLCCCFFIESLCEIYSIFADDSNWLCTSKWYQRQKEDFVFCKSIIFCCVVLFAWNTTMKYYTFFPNNILYFKKYI